MTNKLIKDLDSVCVLIQARLGSQRVPQKMLRPFANTTLLDIAIKNVLNTTLAKRHFYLSLHEPELKKVAAVYSPMGVKVFERSEASANSEGTPMTEMYEWWNQLPYEYVILVNGCSPFLTPKTIDDFFITFCVNDHEGMFGVIEKQNYFWNKEAKLVTPWPAGQAVMNTKLVEPTFEAAHCLYASRLDSIGKGIWMGDFQKHRDITLFSMKEEECFDIDYEWQFKMAEARFINENTNF